MVAMFGQGFDSPRLHKSGNQFDCRFFYKASKKSIKIILQMRLSQKGQPLFLWKKVFWGNLCTKWVYKNRWLGIQ